MPWCSSVYCTPLFQSWCTVALPMGGQRRLAVFALSLLGSSSPGCGTSGWAPEPKKQPEEEWAISTVRGVRQQHTHHPVGFIRRELETNRCLSVDPLSCQSNPVWQCHCDPEKTENLMEQQVANLRHHSRDQTQFLIYSKFNKTSGCSQ